MLLTVVLTLFSTTKPILLRGQTSIKLYLMVLANKELLAGMVLANK